MTVNDEYFTDQLPTIKSHLLNQIMLIRYRGEPELVSSPRFLMATAGLPLGM